MAYNMSKCGMFDNNNTKEVGGNKLYQKLDDDSNPLKQIKKKKNRNKKVNITFIYIYMLICSSDRLLKRYKFA